MCSRTPSPSRFVPSPLRTMALAAGVMFFSLPPCRGDDALTAGILSGLELRCRTLEAFELEFEYEFPQLEKTAGTISRSGRQWKIDVTRCHFDRKEKAFSEPKRVVNWSDGGGWHQATFDDPRAELPSFASRSRLAQAPFFFKVFSPLHALGIVLIDGDASETAADTLAADSTRSSRTLRGGSVELISERFAPADGSNPDSRRRFTLRFSPMPAMRLQSCELSFVPDNNPIKPNFVKRWIVDEYGEVDGVWYPKRCRFQQSSWDETGTLAVHRFSLSPSVDLSRVRSFEANPEVNFRDNVTGKTRLSRQERARLQQKATAAVETAKEIKKQLDRPMRTVDARPRTSAWPNLIPWVVGIGALIAALLIWRKNRKG